MAFDGIVRLVKIGVYSALFAGGCYYGNSTGYQKGHEEGYSEAKTHATAIFKRERDDFCNSLDNLTAKEHDELQRHYTESSKNCTTVKTMLDEEKNKPIEISAKRYAEIVKQPETK